MASVRTETDTKTSIKDLTISSDIKFLPVNRSSGPCTVWDLQSSEVVASLPTEAEWERSKPRRRPDMFPKFSLMKTPLPHPLPADDPLDDDDEEKEEEQPPLQEEPQEDDPDKEEPEEDDLDKPTD